ncbi:TPA: type II toxin-antitoxin system RelE/ParE family toxin [Stenotrophomonas maltophilia]|nr:type II toxin-antitoxin system RelE/ParE family toxin [Stenotrophomonas maltophilia]HDS1024409.1 type II toxin-antitoxin system RelE/ParE family toxin [Stenotrophomonas maltophilia]HDS1029455.1 type II toxin-antitoxin system RelE/ParE family toxin [Stenotrophomonas maltophilia]HDS1036053.1 type II toxin-antitoxin system RelE/ParE family toxin [Stenotrophomonas maltophilia]
MASLHATAAFTRWLENLADLRARAVIVERLQRVARGLQGDVRSIGSGVSELRIGYGPGYRVYFTRREGVIVVLLMGGDKSTQPRDIRRAIAMARMV